jgi:hypothetical protein
VPDSVWFDREGALRMRFQDYASLAVQMDTAFDYKPEPPVTYVYRGKGRLEVAGRR